VGGVAGITASVRHGQDDGEGKGRARARARGRAREGRGEGEMSVACRDRVAHSGGQRSQEV